MRADSNPELKEVYQYLNELNTALGNILGQQERPSQTGYVVTGTLNQVRTINVDTATLDELRKFVGQMVEDDKQRGFKG